MIPENFDFTAQGRRPSTLQILAAWRKAGRPVSFSVTYGETFAEFQRMTAGRWDDSGNGCRGVNRQAVVDALTAETHARINYGHCYTCGQPAAGCTGKAAA